MSSPRLFIITGAMAAGKSTIAENLARQLDKSVYLRGDIFRKMIVNGAASMGPDLTPEASRQLALRHRLGCEVAERYLEAGFSVVYQDILVGPALEEVAKRLDHLSPAIVVLIPRIEVLAQRDRDRAKTGYGEPFPPEVRASALEHDTSRIGFWIDNSDMSITEVVELILRELA
jgi:predicted kinase